MDSHSALHALIQGMTIARLRERKGLRQAELADRLQLTTSMMSRVERGQADLSTFTLGPLCEALDLPAVDFLRLVNEGLSRTEKTVRHNLKLPARGWWEAAQKRVGDAGAFGLVTFAVSVVLSDKEAHQ